MVKVDHSKDFEAIVRMIEQARTRALASVNSELIRLYFELGGIVHEKVKNAHWGSAAVDRLADYIAIKIHGIKGFNRRGLYRMKQFYENYNTDSDVYKLWLKKNKHSVRNPSLSGFVAAVLTQISWTHHRLILSKTKSPEETLFYISYTVNEKSGSRELERQLNSGLYERMLLANKNVSALRTQNTVQVDNLFRDPYVFEFLDLPEQFSEKDLETALVQNLKDFILEIGKGFTYMGRQYRIQVGNKDYYTDLLFYNRDLQCLVLFELKIQEFEPEFLGKLNFYLEALDRDVKRSNEKPSIGILLCKGKDSEVVEYAMARNISPAFVADYETKLIPREVLKSKLYQLGEELKKIDQEND
jgi:predicted nuclease of restriction endonuclease-like (RecB) superfamily